MARTSDVRRRLDALNRQVFRTPLSWTRVMPAVFVGSLILVLIGGFGFTRAEQAVTGERIKPAKVEPTSKPADEKAAGKLTLRAVSAETNEPIAGVSIEYWVRSGEKVQEATISTGEDGTATIEWASGATVNTLGLTARAPGLVPIDILWDDERHSLAVPAEKDLRFEPGTTIGGIVRDQEEHPIGGATVIVYAPPTETDRPNSAFSLGKVQTNPEGRWRLDVAPKDLAAVWANVSHPHYQSDGMRVSRDFDGVLVLKKGLTVTGRVVDAAGRPVKGARAVIERNARSSPQPPTTTTDERGTFTLENCLPGQSIITVEAEGFSPLIQDIRVGERTAPVEFQLLEPGSLLRARVVDIHDKPIAAVRVTVKMWHGHRSIQFRSETDRDGRFEWRNAPKDAVVYNVGRADYMWASPTLTASEHEHTVILYPELVISGRVTDAETRSPVPKFRIVKGERLKKRDQIWWAENNSAEVVNGPYRVRIGDAGDGALIRVEAPGYKAAVSRTFQPNEGSQTFDFALQRARGLSGIVLLPDGKPASRAEVAVATGKNGVSLQLGRFIPDTNIATVATGPDGRFTLPPQDDRFLLIAVSDAGYADASSDEFAKSDGLTLQPWGTIDGGVRIGSRYGSNQEVMFRPFRPDGKRGFFVTYNYSSQTDDRGRFRFEQVIPGPGTVSRVVTTELSGGARRAMPCWPEPVYIKPGQQVQVTIGGKGRPVIGRIVLDGTPESPVEWTQNEPVEINTANGWFASKIDKDGRFRIDDVPAGKHTVKVSVNAGSRFGASDTAIGKLELAFTVPDMPGGRSNEPLDLGTIAAKLFDALKVGELAPDFDVERIGTPQKGRRVKLSDYRGKLVLLNFWQAWDGQNDMLVVKEVQQTFGSDPRFVLISLASSRDSAQPDKFVREKGLNWIHGFDGDGVATRYKVREFPFLFLNGRDETRGRVPVTFLIGPDGRILAHDLIGTDLEAVREALDNVKPPAAPNTTSRPRGAP